VTKETCFLDTNIFLRYLTNDDPVKADRIEMLFNQAAKGHFLLATSHMVIAEIVWTLESYYKQSRLDIEDKLQKIINTPYIELPNEGLVIHALDLYARKNIDFIDAYNIYWMREMGFTKIYTYDMKHFKRIEWLEILSP